MIWTDERVETLRKLWSEGLSASQIAAQLGGVSRNAVIGKVHRLKLSGRGRTAPSPARPKKPAQATTAKPPQRPAPAPRPVTASVGATALQAQFEAAPARHLEASTENIVVPISRQLQLIELSERTCKWPIGDPLADDFHFCGNESGETGPYCRYHARLAFQPASERRRVR
ncbi:GcrA family cell cycle regulator [Pseudaminobacter sp. 19-2017]|uniref:GcrA family cell cycle regulator n=1 Tax=Pseudaminobacter soli (ex Zhang et al. 2022) TaxID=2831468 RepID=A0A942I2C9_9HYPH|nr:GcrA family cell cycle regulator [Pseudaminobacter soli]MBS3648558.1 GcrA family cell cycle regulator [Pseudaminobacter soli]